MSTTVDPTAVPHRRHVPEDVLRASLGPSRERWFTDSRERDFELHLGWHCGCTAQKLGLVGRLWDWRPCSEHDG